MAVRVALIIPALNEEEAIGAVLSELAEVCAREPSLQPAQVIVVDNGSNDRTAERALNQGAQIVSEPRRGYGRACLAGIARVSPEVDVVVFMDADGSADPSDLVRLVAPIARGEAELVLGSRVLGEVEPASLTHQQRLGNALAATLLRALYGARCTDLGPFRAIRRDALARLGMRDTNFGWTIEMQIRAHQKCLRVLELPVRSRCRRAGRSKISGSLRASLLAGAKIVWTILRYRFSA